MKNKILDELKKTHGINKLQASEWLDKNGLYSFDSIQVLIDNLENPEYKNPLKNLPILDTLSTMRKSYESMARKNSTI